MKFGALSVIRPQANAPANQPAWGGPGAILEAARGNVALLRQALFSKQVPLTELWRTYYGRAVDLNRIEQAIRGAEVGMMRQLTDLVREMLDRDPTLSNYAQKRFGGLSALDWDMLPASGPGVNPERAQFWAKVCKDQFNRIPSFRQRVFQLAWGLCDGRALLENMWEGPSPGPVRWRIKQIGWIHPRRIAFGPEREFRIVDGLYSTSYFPAIGEDVRAFPHKFITFQPQLFGEYPEREGLGPRSLYWAFFKRFGQRERMILTELFGKPWRIIEADKDAPIPGGDKEDIASADEQIAALGGQSIARLPRGYHLNVQAPQGDNGGKIHRDVIDDANKELAKLWLGQDMTSEAKPMGLGSKQSEVGQSEQQILLKRDAWAVSERFEDDLVDPIVLLNGGEEELINAPSFVLKADPEADRTVEIDRLGKAVQAGLPIALEEAYEVAGYRKPSDDEPRLELSAAPGEATPRPVVVYPDGAAPMSGQTSGTPTSPTDPLLEPGHGAAPTPGVLEEPPQNPAVAENAPSITPALDADPLAITQALKKAGVQLLVLRPDGSVASIADALGRLTFAAQPGTVNGSPDAIIERGIREFVKETGALSEAIAKATGAAPDPKAPARG